MTNTERAQSIVAKAEKEGRKLTTAERKEVGQLMLEASKNFVWTTERDEMIADGSMQKLIDEGLAKVYGKANGGSTAGGSLSRALKAAGFDRKTNKDVIVPAGAAIPGLKTGSFDGVESDGELEQFSPAARRAGAPLGADTRYAYTALRSEDVDFGTTAVPSFRQKSRTLGDDSAGLRALDSTAPKAEIDTEAELVVVEMQQVAFTNTGTPNILFELPAFKSFCDADLRLAFAERVDKFVVDALETAITATGDPGANLVEEIALAALAVEAEGYSPDTLILSPEDALALALTPDIGTGDYLAGKMNDLLAGLTRVVSKSISTPMVLDRNAAAVLYVSPVRTAAFEENDGSTNTTLLRIEGNLAVNVERPTAGAIVGGVSSS